MAQEQGILIQVSDDNITWADLATVAADTVTYTHTGLPEGTLKYYRVKALGDGVNISDSEWSNVIQETTGKTISFASFTLENDTLNIPTSYYQANESSPTGRGLYSPDLYYNNGRTYFAYKTSGSNRVGIIELTPWGIRPPHIIAANANVQDDEHDRPVFRFEGNRMFIVQEADHGVFDTSFHKALSDNDSLLIDSNAGDIGGTSFTTDISYPLIYDYQGRMVVIGRFDVTPESYDAGYKLSSAGIEGTWTDMIKILDKDTDEVRRYQGAVNNKQNSPDIVFLSSARDVNNNWHRFNVFRMVVNGDNSITYKTIDGRTISTSGVMTVAEAQMGEYYDIGVGNQGYIPQADIDEFGNFYCVHSDGNNNMILTIWKSDTEIPTNTQIDFPDAPTLVTNDPPQTSACLAIIPRSLTDIETYWRVNNGTRVVVKGYRSEDEGATWTSLGEVDFGFDVSTMSVAANYGEIADNQNFLMIAGGDAVDAFSPVQLGIKRAAFGAIQAETNVYDGLTPITENAFNASALMSYFVESGKVTLSGSTVTSLIDQSAGGNNLTPEGSPVVDNATTPTNMILDGTNDALNYPTTLLDDKTKNLLFLAVVDVNGGAFGISNSSNANNFIVLANEGLGINYQNRYDDPEFNKIVGDASSTGYAICAWLFRGPNHDVPMWLNGKMTMNSYAAGGFDREQGSYWLPIATTNFSTGKLVRDTISYVPMNYKHTSIHEVSSESDVLDRIKFLGNKYGITLNNAYR